VADLTWITVLAAHFLPIDAVFLGEKPKHDGPVYSGEYAFVWASQVR